ncbi:MAG: 50S ribosomal protein L29 [Candidatus Nealsonbacteria bacterium]|nr:50S ribosomal protein L29 [Candidatus Nealsonbacteria bacterium]
MKILELTNKTRLELEALIVKKREDIRKLKFRLDSKKVTNVKLMKETRKDVARILTILKDKE